MRLIDLKSLSSTNSAIYAAFLEGNFVETKLSSIPIDHAHEENNKLVVKGDGGEEGWEKAQQS